MRVASLGPVVLVRSYCRHCRCPTRGHVNGGTHPFGRKAPRVRGLRYSRPPAKRVPPFRPPPCCAALRACSPLRRAPPQGFQPCPSRGLARSGVPPSRLGRAVRLSRDFNCGVGYALRFDIGLPRRNAFFFVRCRLRRPLLHRLATARYIQGWTIGPSMNTAPTGL